MTRAFQLLDRLLLLLSGEHVQVLRFLVVGATGFAINILTFALGFNVLGIHYQPAVVGAFVVGGIWSFTVHRAWTFEATEGHTGHQALRFTAVALLQTVLGVGITTLCVELASVPEHASEAIAAIIIAPVTFLVHRVWTFLLPAALIDVDERERDLAGV